MTELIAEDMNGLMVVERVDCCRMNMKYGIGVIVGRDRTMEGTNIWPLGRFEGLPEAGMPFPTGNLAALLMPNKSK